jgi:type IV pilus assembly protein PilB
MGVDPYLIAPTLCLCIAQRLARRIYPDSKKAIPMDESTAISIEKQFVDLPAEYRASIPQGKTVYEAVSVPECPSGMRGRIPVFEMFAVTKEMQNAILKTPQEQDLYKIARTEGMLSIREDAIVKALQGDIPYQEVYNF